jgi:mannose/fructose-specific phosphotransferase system component IIA
MNQFLIATHTRLAEGFVRAITFFKSDADNVDYLNCYEESTEVERMLREKLESYSGRNVIVLTDLAGGSVNQVAAKLRPEYGFHLITGINLAVLLELVLKTEDISADDIRKSIAAARNDLRYMNDFTQQLTDMENEEL